MYFATTNADKVEEAREYLDRPVKQLDYDYAEIQSDSLADIAAAGAREAHEATGEPVIVDDSGLFVAALEGFPGPYSAYVEDTLGIERVSALARREESQRATFRGVVAYADSDGPRPSGETSGDEPRVRVETFEGAVQGQIVAPRGEGGFGYDPVFEHGGRTFAEMPTREKNALSHRGRALGKLAEWLAENG